MSALTWLTRHCCNSFLPASKFLVRMPLSSEKKENCDVYLTFDDGPHSERTPRVLDQLAAMDAKATFFFQGQNISSNKELIIRTKKEGHSVGTHSWSHYSSADVTLSDWINDVNKARIEMEQITSEKCSLFRPPYGYLTPLPVIQLLKRKYTIVLWSHDTKDYEAKTGADISNWFINQQQEPGMVILMHDAKEMTSLFLKDAIKYWEPSTNFLPIPM